MTLLPSPSRRASLFAQVMAGGAGLIGFVVLWGWSMSLTRLAQLEPGRPMMTPLTACLIILASGALLAATTARRRTIVPLLTALGISFSLFFLAEYYLEFGSRFDLILFRAGVMRMMDVYPGRPSPHTLVSNLTIAAAILLVSRPQLRAVYAAQIFALATLYGIFVVAVGYFFGLIGFFGISPENGMAILTALSFVALAMGVLGLSAAHGISATVLGPFPSSRFTRQLLPIAVITPLAASAIIKLAERAGFFDDLAGDALMVVSCMIFPSVLILRQAVVQAERESAEIAAATAQASANENRRRVLFDEVATYIFMLGPTGKLEALNQAARVFLGAGSDGSLGKTFSEISQWDGEPQVQVEIASLMERAMRGEKSRLATRYVDASGERCSVDVQFTPIIDFEKVTAILVEGHDTTELKRAQQSAEKARDAAVVANRAKDHFLAALSHELRTPLNPVLLVASAEAANPELTPEVRSHFAGIAKNVQLESLLIEDLLDVTKIVRGKLTLVAQPVQLHDTLHRTLENVRASLGEKQLDITFDLQATHDLIEGDEVRLQQIFWNILRNAVKFTPTGGRIQLGTANSGSLIVVTISDNGLGMTPAELARIFDAFAQGDHSLEAGHRFGGLGLGLAITRNLIELHRGSIEARSAGVGQGSTFTVKFPVTAVVAKVEIPPVPELREMFLAKPVTILLVEDHEPTRNSLVRLLTRRRYEVTSAGSVSAALASANDAEFDLLLSDIGLPDGDGYQLLAQLPPSKMRKVAISGFGTEEDVAKSLAAGFEAHIIKPVTMQALENVLERRK